MKRIYPTIFGVFAFVWFSTTVKAQNNTNDICGFWYTRNQESIINFYADSAGKYSAAIYWIKEPLESDNRNVNFGNPKIDKHTGKQLLGTRIVKDIVFDKQTKWYGELYNPQSGKKIACSIGLSNDKNTMMLKGYIGNELFGKTVNWKRK